MIELELIQNIGMDIAVELVVALIVAIVLNVIRSRKTETE